MLGANPLPSNPEDEFNVTATSSNLEATPSTPSRNGTNETFMSFSSMPEEEFVCTFYNADFIIYSSLGSFYIPCVIMVFLYIRIFSVSKLLFKFVFKQQS